MSYKPKCECNNFDDCGRCGLWFSKHSPHYDSVYKKEICEVTCCIGGNKTFDGETGELIR